jgi:hypothetical protein
MVTGLMGLDEASAVAALYVLIVQVYVYKDLTWRDVLRIARESVALAGAILIIIMMATALTNWVIQDRIPLHILEFFTANGMDTVWEFIIVLNIFLFILGVVMDEFSAMLVALPLVMPLAATFGLSPVPPRGHVPAEHRDRVHLAADRGEPLHRKLPVQPAARDGVPRRHALRVDAHRRAGAVHRLPETVPRSSSTRPSPRCTRRPTRPGRRPRDAWLLECVQEGQEQPPPMHRRRQAEVGASTG